MSDAAASRRHFLREAGALRDELRGVPAVSPDMPAAARRFVASVRRRAMACDWEVQLAASNGGDSLEPVLAALDLIESLDDQLSIYRENSEMTFINRHAALGPVNVEPRLFALLQLAQQLYCDTDGAMDITSGPLSEAWGFSRRQGHLPSDDEIAQACALVGMRHVVLDSGQRTIAFTQAGMRINLHCIGKGFALDRMAELLSLADVDDYLLHGGKSSVLTRGAQPGDRSSGDPSLCPSNSPAANRAWTIGLRHPLRPQVRLAEFDLVDQALSTSGSGTQFFRHRGRRLGHILDPRTGSPVEGVHSVTVICPSAAEADALSTAFYVMGPDKAAEFCAKRAELGALFVLPASNETDVRLVAINLDNSTWRQVGR